MSYYNSGILYASPGGPFEATLDSIYTGGITGAPTFRISIIDTPTGDYYIEPTSEGIYEKPSGSGIYAWSGTAPNVTGQYTIYWDDGNDPPEIYAVEDFIVTGQPLLWAVGMNATYEPLSTGETKIINIKNVGPPSVPQEIKRHRKQIGDMLRRFGQPVIHRHMYTLDDVEKGIAKKCPACFDEAYSQVRNDCPVCHSVGFVSVRESDDRWISSSGEIVTEKTIQPAPLYGGFAEPTLTMFMQPDVPIDLFKINDRGLLTRVEDAKAYTYYDPIFADNDILITVDLAQDGYTIKNVLDYYQAKKANQHTIRGWGRFQSKNQNQYIVGQEFEMALIPPNNVLRRVSPGAISYGLV